VIQVQIERLTDLPVTKNPVQALLNLHGVLLH
jgi:hypothetical protein